MYNTIDNTGVRDYIYFIDLLQACIITIKILV